MKTILLLHGAIGAADQLEPLAAQLRESYTVRTLNFSGHGGTADNGAFSIPAFAQEVLAYLDAEGLLQVSIFGYSMGGYVALYLAKQHPERVEKIVTLATKFHWDEPTAAKEAQMLDAEKIAIKVPAFAAALEKRHAPNDWEALLNKTKDMLHAMGANNPLQVADYAAIQTPVTVCLGDADKMVTLDETLAVYKTLPHAKLAVLPATQHPIEQANILLLAFIIKQFIA